VTGKIKRATVTLESTGNYYLSLQAACENQTLPKTNKAVGLDMGIADLAISSDGIKYAAFDAKKLEKQATQWQSKYSRRRHLAKVNVAFDKHNKRLVPRELEDFSNWQKAGKHKARLQAKMANQRKDYLHKLTTQLIKHYDMIFIEDLKTKNLLKNHYLAKSISNASWRMFRTLLEYKCSWYGKRLIVVKPNYTSQVCSSCDYPSGKKPLEIREWTCPRCHTHHDRDTNAAVNILNQGLKAI
jgi:transposase, IS605 OrfB family, central region